MTYRMTREEAMKRGKEAAARWAKVPMEERSAIMRERALQRLAKMTPEEKQAHIDKMMKARLK